MRWDELASEGSIIRALDHAGTRPEAGTQDDKRKWSERFANGCAIAVAEEFRKFDLIADKRILPESIEGGTEPLTPLGAGTRKRIDVTIIDAVLGLEIGVSLKGLNFKDKRSGNFDKNLTGRLYELGDEVRLVHEHLPHCLMTGVIFLPLDSTSDKTEKANSSFAHAVMKLRERTGRLDPALHAHSSRCDMSYVGLYAHGADHQRVSRGVVRFLNVDCNPPRRGRPKVVDTKSLSDLVGEIIARANATSDPNWADPEAD